MLPPSWRIEKEVWGSQKWNGFQGAAAPPPRSRGLRNLTGVMRNLRGMALKEPKALEGDCLFPGRSVRRAVRGGGGVRLAGRGGFRARAFRRGGYMRRLRKGRVPPGPLRGRHIASAEKPAPEIRGGRRARRSQVSRPRRVALSPTILLRGQRSLCYLRVDKLWKGLRTGQNGTVFKGPPSDCKPPEERPLSPTMLLRGQQSLCCLRVDVLGLRKGQNGAIFKGPFSDCKPP